MVARPSIFDKLTFFRTLNLFLIDQDLNVNQLRLVTKKGLHKGRTILNYYGTSNGSAFNREGWGGGGGLSATEKGVSECY